MDEKKIRAQALEEAAVICDGEKLVGEIKHEADRGYNMAVRHVSEAIRCAAVTAQSGSAASGEQDPATAEISRAEPASQRDAPTAAK